MHKRMILGLAAALLASLTGSAAESTVTTRPLWMRDVQISPDGTEIAFCYKGDIYKVSAGGGTAIHSGDAALPVSVVRPSAIHTKSFLILTEFICLLY
jgi:hypothetical protein